MIHQIPKREAKLATTDIADFKLRFVVQRVQNLKLLANDTFCGGFERGLLVYFGVGGKLGLTEEEQLATQIDQDELGRLLKLCADKLLRLRTFPRSDSEPYMDLSLQDLGAEGDASSQATGLALVSQFTLFADFAKGNRPSFSSALPRGLALQVFDLAKLVFKNTFAERLVTGVFGADMKIHYMNDGPVTYMFDASSGKIVSL